MQSWNGCLMQESVLQQFRVIEITDQEGRRLKVSQGAGDGSMFGTDETNSGGLLARETMRNNISAEWVGDTLKLQTLVVEKYLYLVSLQFQIVKYCLM